MLKILHNPSTLLERPLRKALEQIRFVSVNNTELSPEAGKADTINISTTYNVISECWSSNRID